MKTAIVILAAGTSSRMGHIKQLLPYKHTTLIGWTIQNSLNISNTEIYSVLGANAEIIKNEITQYPVHLLFNANFKNGISTSIQLAVKEIETTNFDAILILLADQPYITSKYISDLILQSQKNPSKIIASNYKNAPGVPALFPKTYFNHLKKLSGDKGAKLLLKECIANVIMMPEINLIDIDTPEDYSKVTGNL